MMVDKLWYQTHPGALALWPLSWLFGGVVMLRRSLYRRGWLRSTVLPAPVIVIGNITVGGTGKTPLVLAVVEHLKQWGRQPGIITRGFGGRAKRWPCTVTATSDPAMVGDEAVLLARRASVPVVAAPSRVAAGQALLQQYPCDVIVADDGLQHLALARDVEIVVVDAARGLGNGRLLPAGPLREPPGRLAECDLILRRIDGDDCTVEKTSIEYSSASNGAEFHLTPVAFVTLDGERRALAAYRGIEVDALAGIGYPKRFFDTLRHLGMTVREHPRPDHFAYGDADMALFGARSLLMTEKDAVKCVRLRHPADAAYLEMNAVLNEQAERELKVLLERLF